MSNTQQQAWAAQLRSATAQKKRLHIQPASREMKIDAQMNRAKAVLKRALIARDTDQVAAAVESLVHLRAQQLRAQIEKDKALFRNIPRKTLQKRIRAYYKDCNRLIQASQDLLVSPHG